MNNIADRILIQDVICAVTLHSDHSEWEQALALYTPDAVIDYSSVSGPESANIQVHEHRRRLLAFLPGFEARQHQTTNFEIIINGDEAQTRSQVRATHILGAEAWVAGATYHHRLRRTAEGWKITYQRADLTYQEGQHLIARARDRVTATSSKQG